ncbi:transcriptional repressor (plasmid) [Lichenicola cladoniae]|uniref:Ferric uptake regulation protein n=1 Tax=Lichenicola cladoniae TaxID=1484109 RepID=A0A6M8I088_9PROT|nr:transcriptional repressor [Lichenicola cladoniae]NPD67656.1 transcriptional repressor [Acetobacteraceae bacterium]QKE93817.1 transcriptional repressor [Lichenicola cladoniae]
MEQVLSVETKMLLDQAARICERRGTRLTPLRREVLGLVLESGNPARAYDLLDRLKTSHKSAAPPTVYRALDFLCEHGLIHKVERLAAFIGCIHPSEDEHHDHVGRFLICTQCGGVMEFEDRSFEEALRHAVTPSGFVPSRATIEVEGICAICTEAASGDAACQMV